MGLIRIALDLPGHGRSGDSARQAVPDHAAVMVDFITEFLDDQGVV